MVGGCSELMAIRDALYIGPMLSRLLGRALPSRCRICHAWPAQPLCEACVAAFAQPVARCPRCALRLAEHDSPCPDCLRDPPPLERCVAAVDYAWPWSDCIAQFKFGADPGWSDALALLMRSTPWAEPLIDACELAVPMPMPERRLRERGFNQALELARRLAPQRCDATLLMRLPDARDLPEQHTLSRAARLANLRGAMLVDPLRLPAVQGRQVLLVDDVMTTGASLRAAAGALLQAGARSVSALVLARTPAPGTADAVRAATDADQALYRD